LRHAGKIYGGIVDIACKSLGQQAGAGSPQLDHAFTNKPTLVHVHCAIVYLFFEFPVPAKAGVGNAVVQIMPNSRGTIKLNQGMKATINTPIINTTR
jgi:hypothetical protein